MSRRDIFCNSGPADSWGKWPEWFRGPLDHEPKSPAAGPLDPRIRPFGVHWIPRKGRPGVHWTPGSGWDTHNRAGYGSLEYKQRADARTVFFGEIPKPPDTHV